MMRGLGRRKSWLVSDFLVCGAPFLVVGLRSRLFTCLTILMRRIMEVFFLFSRILEMSRRSRIRPVYGITKFSWALALSLWFFIAPSQGVWLLTVILVGSGTRASRLFVIYVISKATNLQCAQTKISVAGVVSRATLPLTVLKNIIFSWGSSCSSCAFRRCWYWARFCAK